MADGRFAITDIPGAGAFAVVCVATDRTTDQSVALKVLRLHVRTDAEAVDRLRDEGRIQGRLQHPNVARCLEVIEYPTHPVLVMEHIEGASLDRVIYDNGPIPPALAVTIAIRVASVLDHAWRAPDDSGEPMRIVHRDLKPNNVLLSRDGVVKVIDFGIAKGDFDGRRAKSLFVVQGSAGFDAPERSDGAWDGQAVDVYGMGAFLLALLTGHVPMLSKRADKRDADLDRHLARVVDDPVLNASALRELLAAMLATDVERRPAMPDVIQRLVALRDAADEGELAAYAARVVPGLLGSDKLLEERQGWVDVAFLETDAPVIRTIRPVPEVAGQVRRFLRKPDWEERVPELEAIFERAERFVTRPLIEVLDRAKVPWYKPWLRTARPGEIEAALLLLCDRADEGAVARRAQQLVEYPDARVMAAARFLLAQRG